MLRVATLNVVPEIWRELLFLCVTGPSSRGPGVMLALAFAAGARSPRSYCHLKVRGMFLREARPEAQATSKKEVGIRNTLHNRYSGATPGGSHPEVPRRPIQVGPRARGGFMQGCGYGHGCRGSGDTDFSCECAYISGAWGKKAREAR